MTGIGAFDVAVITVSVLSSSCVTSYPVGLRTSQSTCKCSTDPMDCIDHVFHYITSHSLEILKGTFIG